MTDELEKSMMDDDRKFAIGAALGYTELSLANGEKVEAQEFFAMVETIHDFLTKNKSK